MKKGHGGRLITGIFIILFLVCVGVVLAGKGNKKHFISTDEGMENAEHTGNMSNGNNTDADILFESVAESISEGNEKAADNITAFGEICHAEKTYYREKTFTSKMDFRVVDITVTKECGDDFAFITDKETIYSQQKYGWNNVYVPYSEIVDKDMNMIADCSYVLVTIEVTEKSSEDFKLLDEARVCCLASFTLKHEDAIDPTSQVEPKAQIRNDLFDARGTVVLEPGETIRFTNIYIVKDDYINEELVLKADPYGSLKYYLELGLGEEK